MRDDLEPPPRAVLWLVFYIALVMQATAFWAAYIGDWGSFAIFQILTLLAAIVFAYVRGQRLNARK